MLMGGTGASVGSRLRPCLKYLRHLRNTLPFGDGDKDPRLFEASIVVHVMRRMPRRGILRP